MRIRSYLLLLTAVVLVPGLLAAGIAVKNVREGERQAALRGLRETVRATSLLVDGEVQRSLGALGALGQSQHLQTGNFAALFDEASAADQHADVWTLVFDATGAQRLNTSLPYGTLLPPSASAAPSAAQARVSEVLQARRAVASDLIVGARSGTLLTTIYTPARASPMGSFVVAQSFSVDHWKQLAIKPEGRAEWIVAIIDRTGKFIWRSHRTAEFVGRSARPELVAAAAASPDGLIRHSTLEGIDSYDAFSHSALTGWTIAVAAPVATIEAAATQAVVWLTTGVATALAVALLGATLLSRVLLRAIDAACEAARSLGRGEPPDTPRTAVFEIDALNSALRDAAHLLAQEQGTRRGIEQQREQLLENERLARHAAQQENVAKDRFLALLGHELRNPMAAVAGATDVLARSPLDATIQQRFLGIIQRQNRHIRRIVDDLLDVSRMRSGQIALAAPHALELSGCVGSCVESLQVTERGRSHRWEVRTDEVWVWGDPVRLEQIVNNLAVNALQYSPPNAAIGVVVSASAGEAVIEVTDAGPGIAPEWRDRIFEPFVQGPPAADRPPSGLGIGLSLVKQLVELHRGRISVRPGPGGVGSTFSVSLPRHAAPAAGAPVEAPEQRCRAESPQRPAYRVLLVDDNADVRVATARLMRSMGHDVTEAADGADAVRSALARIPDVVVMDLGLPGRNGYAIAAEMGALPALRGVPLIALSGYGQPADRAASLAAGFSTHLVKPVDMQALAQAIEAQVTGQAGRPPAPGKTDG